MHAAANEALAEGTRGYTNLLGAVDTQTDVAVAVTNDDEGFETGALTGLGLLLHRGDLHHLILRRESGVMSS